MVRTLGFPVLLYFSVFVGDGPFLPPTVGVVLPGHPADGKLFLANDVGDILIVRAGRTFEPVGTNSMGELLMATPALSEGVMYVRGTGTLFAIGRR